MKTVILKSGNRVLESFNSGIRESGNKRSITTRQVIKLFRQSYKSSVINVADRVSGMRDGAAYLHGYSAGGNDVRKIEASLRIIQAYVPYIEVVPGRTRKDAIIILDLDPIERNLKLMGGDNGAIANQVISCIRVDYYDLQRQEKFLTNRKYLEKQQRKTAASKRHPAPKLLTTVPTTPPARAVADSVLAVQR